MNQDKLMKALLQCKTTIGSRMYASGASMGYAGVDETIATYDAARDTYKKDRKLFELVCADFEKAYIKGGDVWNYSVSEVLKELDSLGIDAAESKDLEKKLLSYVKGR